MDFMRLLRSFEDFIYEVMTWLVFYPRTLWRVLRHPLRMMDYSDAEQARAPDDQYTDTLNPVLFLLLSLLAVHAVELATHTGLADTDRALLTSPFGGFLNSDQNLLLSRAICFGIFPLMYAIARLKLAGEAIDRNTLRQPFLAQCYVGSAFAGVISLTTTVARLPDPAWQTGGLAGIGVAALWYLAIQIRRGRERLSLGYPAALWMAVWTFIKSVLIIFAAALVIAWPGSI